MMTTNSDDKVKRVFTCVFVLDAKNKKILLGFKKRGFLQYLWNGFGGKVEPGETVLDAAYRELYEECGLTSSFLQHNGVLTVEKEGISFISKVHLYTTDEYNGEVVESDEMIPRWFDLNKIPYEKMCYDHQFWLPLILNKKKVEVFFKYDSKGKVLKHSIAWEKV